MRIACQWLRSLLDLSDAESAALTPARIAGLLTSLGLEVERIEHVGAEVASVVVGEVRGKRPHPRADRLTLVELFDGREVLPVVCGASNVPEVGGKVAFAPVGTRLPNGVEIAAREVRGERSHGMLCSEVELDVGADGAGILVLPEELARKPEPERVALLLMAALISTAASATVPEVGTVMEKLTAASAPSSSTLIEAVAAAAGAARAGERVL